MNGDARPRATNQRSRWPCLIKDFYHLLRGLNQPDPPFSLSLMVYGTWFPRSCGVEEARVVIWKKQIDPNCQFLASLQRVRKGFGHFYLDSLGSSDRPVSNPLCFCRFLSRPGPSLLQLRFSCSLLSFLFFPVLVHVAENTEVCD